MLHRYTFKERRATVFAETLRFLLESKVDALQATVLTPFPGTPLFRELQRQDRITDLDWGHYDFGHVVFEPARMDAAIAQGYGNADWTVIAKDFLSPR